MADPRAQVHHLMRGLVKRCFGGPQNAAKEIADFWHPTGNAGDDFDTADISRKMNGTRRWTADDVMAVQAITGSRRVTDAMAAVGEDETPAPCPKSMLQHVRDLTTEGGEGTNAILALSEGGCPHAARSELQDIVEAAQAAIRDIDAQPTSLTDRKAG